MASFINWAATNSPFGVYNEMAPPNVLIEDPLESHSKTVKLYFPAPLYPVWEAQSSDHSSLRFALYLTGKDVNVALATDMPVLGFGKI